MKRKLSADQERGLYDSLDRSRKNTTVVKVDKDALYNLLYDYSKLVYFWEIQNNKDYPNDKT